MSNLQAYIHPAAALVAVALALLVFKLGLGLRDSRLRKRPQSVRGRRWHARLGLWTASLWFAAFVLGPLSAVLLRKWRPMDTAHGWLGLAGALCLATTAALGYRLKRRQLNQRRLHTLFAVLSVMLALSVAVFGLELLP